MERVSAKGRITVIVIAAFGIGIMVALIAFWMLDDPASREDFWLDVGKAGLQTSIVGVTGALLAAALNYLQDLRTQAQRELDQQRDKLRRRNEYRLDVLRQVRTAYIDVKRARRDLQAAGLARLPIAPASPVDASTTYFERIETINEAQLALEAVRDDLPPLLGAGSSTEAVTAHLRTMENYLNKGVLDEYKQYGAAIRGDLTNSRFEQLPALNDLLGSTRVTTFRKKFAEPFHAIVTALQADILQEELSAPSEVKAR